MGKTPKVEAQLSQMTLDGVSQKTRSLKPGLGVTLFERSSLSVLPVSVCNRLDADSEE